MQISLETLLTWVRSQGRPAHIVVFDNGTEAVSIFHREQVAGESEPVLRFARVRNLDEARDVLCNTTY